MLYVLTVSLPQVTLLETGSTQLIRNTAAQQLADVQKNHPDELFNLLTRVVPYLRSPSWDTRTAAARAIGGIVEHAEKYDPNATLDGVKDETNGHHDTSTKIENGSQGPTSPEQLQLSTLDVEAILTNGKELLGSAGKQYDFKLAGLNPTERLAHQKKTLTTRLGLGGEYMEDDLVTEKDIAIRSSSFSAMPGMPRLDTEMSRNSSGGDEAMVKSPDDMTPQTPAGGEMSKRQLNMLKRRRKEELKRDNKKFRYDFTVRQGSTGVAQTPVDSDIKQEIKQEPSENGNPDYFSLERKEGDDDSKIVSEYKGMPVQEKSTLLTDAEEEGNEWPFERLCEFLTVDLFDPQWEIRHGAAMGLREIIRVHGAGAGRRAATRTSSRTVS